MSLSAAQTDYVRECLECFDGLGAILRQLGALLLTEAVGGRRRILDHMSREACAKELSHVADRLQRCPDDPASGHHRHHVARALEDLRQAAVCLDRRSFGRVTGDDPLPLLKRAHVNLVQAERLLPGFAIVDLDQSCCAEHRGRVRANMLLQGAGDQH